MWHKGQQLFPGAFCLSYSWQALLNVRQWQWQIEQGELWGHRFMYNNVRTYRDCTHALAGDTEADSSTTAGIHGLTAASWQPRRAAADHRLLQIHRCRRGRGHSALQHQAWCALVINSILLLPATCIAAVLTALQAI